MNKRTCFVALSFLFLACAGGNTPRGRELPDGVMRLMRAYPDWIVGFDGDSLVLGDGSRLCYDDGRARSREELLDKPDIEDMFCYVYDTAVVVPAYGEDPGRIRNQALLGRMYGASGFCSCGSGFGTAMGLFTARGAETGRFGTAAEVGFGGGTTGAAGCFADGSAAGAEASSLPHLGQARARSETLAPQ